MRTADLYRRLDQGQDKTRNLEVDYASGLYIVTERVKTLGQDVIAFNAAEIEKLYEFKLKMEREIAKSNRRRTGQSDQPSNRSKVESIR